MGSGIRTRSTDPAGQVVLTMRDGKEHKREMKDDKMHGKGELTFRDGSKYNGEFKDNKMHGQGQRLFLPGFAGGWRYNKQDGKGELLLPIGAKYIRECRDGKAEIATLVCNGLERFKWVEIRGNTLVVNQGGPHVGPTYYLFLVHKINNEIPLRIGLCRARSSSA
eukprot:jgi/Botrbrau1/6282/Bobra.0129s0027.1